MKYNYEGHKIEIKGKVIKETGNGKIEILLNNLNREEKQVITGLYVEHLRPVFDVNIVQDYQ